MKPTVLQLDRLRQLADFIVKSEPQYNFDDTLECREIGQDEYEWQIPSHHNMILVLCPHIFPNDWKLLDNGEPVWIEDPYQTCIASAVLFFGLSPDMFMHIFSCESQRMNMWGGRMLTGKSTAQDIAKNIYDLIFSVRE